MKRQIYFCGSACEAWMRNALGQVAAASVSRNIDAGRRLIGIVAPDGVSSERLVLASHLRKFMADAPAENPQMSAAAAERLAAAEIYERALKITVQVIVVS